MNRYRPYLPLISLIVVLIICIFEQWTLARLERRAAEQPRPEHAGWTRNLAVPPTVGDNGWLAEFGAVMTQDEIRRGLTALVIADTRPARAHLLRPSLRRLVELDQARQFSADGLMNARHDLADVLIDIAAELDADQLQRLQVIREERRRARGIDETLARAISALEQGRN